MKKESITFKKMWVYKHSFQKRSKMVLDIRKDIEDVDKAKENKEVTDLEEDVETASIS